MLTKTVKVINEQGMHMRPAGLIAKTAKEYADCEVKLKANGKEVKATSPMQIMSACIKKDCEVEIICNGAGEQEVMDKIAQMFADGFDE